jgi:hypothetical protein
MRKMLENYRTLCRVFNKPYFYVWAFFFFYLSVGLLVYKDYGISSDEAIQRYHAIVTAKYLASLFIPQYTSQDFFGVPQLADYVDREYGVIFDLPMYIADVLLGYQNSTPEKMFYLRHICTFLLFFASTFFFYLIVRNRFNSWPMGLIGALFLILSPRIFAESFYNLKDIVFLSFFIIVIYFLIRFLNNKTHMNSLLFALSSALMVDQRITGIFIPFLVVFICAIDSIKENTLLKDIFKSLFPMLTYLAFFIIFVVLLWPYLWENPIRNLINAYSIMSKYPWSGKIVYMGKFIKATEIPWHYIPVWLLITTPVLYSVFFLAGFFASLGEVYRNRINFYSHEKEKQDLIFLLLFLVPLAAVILLKSVLYNGWRQMYFIYAPFLLIALKGLVTIKGHIRESRTSIRARIAVIILISVILLSVIATSYQMIRYHPFQNVYFNFLAGNQVRGKFDLDYWGLSYRQALEFIVKNDKRHNIKLATYETIDIVNNATMLNDHDYRRLLLTDVQHADYFLTNYRLSAQQYEYSNEVFSISINETKIMSVFKLR